MKPTPNLGKKRPEKKIQREIMAFLSLRGWYCQETHGNMYQSGFPDLYITHKRYGGKWVEIKLPKGSRLTAAQIENFPKMVAFGTPVWIMNGANEAEYQKIFGPSNWFHYSEAWK